MAPLAEVDTRTEVDRASAETLTDSLFQLVKQIIPKTEPALEAVEGVGKRQKKPLSAFDEDL